MTILCVAMLGATLAFDNVAGAAPNQEKASDKFSPQKGDPKADPRDLPGLKSAPEREDKAQSAELGSFEDRPTMNGVPPKGWKPTLSGYVEGESTVIPSLTTPTKIVYQNPDGTQTQRSSLSPVRFKNEEGQWQEYEERLVEDGGSLVPESAPPGNEIASSGDADTLVTVATSEGPVGLQTSDAESGDPEVDGSVATFRDAVGRSDLEVSLTPTGFETTLVVPELVDGGHSFEQTLAVPQGVTARSGPAGVELVNSDGELVGSYGSGMAEDASAGSAEQPVSTQLVGQQGEAVTVRVSVPEEWFQDPARRFPVTIDPVFSVSGTTGTLDTFVASNSSTAQGSATSLLVGAQASNTAVKRRTFMKFDLSSITATNRQALSATLDIWNGNSQTCTAKSMEVRDLTSAFSASTIWSNQPSMGSNVVTSSFSKGYSASCPAGTQSIDVTSIVNPWVANTATNYGFGLKATNESDGTADKTIFSSESWVAPTLTVTYNRPPTANGTQATPADGAFVKTTQPTLAINAGTDPDPSDVLQYWWQVSTQPDATGQVVASGWLPQDTNGLSWTVPKGALTDGQTYYWTVFTYDGYAWPATPPSVRSFTVDLRLGMGQWPSDEYGETSVNLTNGNLVTGHDSPSMETATGPLGVSFSYNSQPQTQSGLTGSYYNLAPGSSTHRPTSGQVAQVVRRDPSVVFDWSLFSPASTVQADNFYVKWSGTFTAPAAGNYKFGGSCSDGMTITVNSSLAFDRWSGCSASDPDPWSGLVALTAGQTVPFEVEHWEGTGNAVVNVKVRGPGLPTGIGTDLQAEWLTPGTVPRLPSGWQASLDLAKDLTYVKADIATDSFNVIDASGAVHHYTWSASKNAWQSPPGEETTLTGRPDGGFVLKNSEMTTSFSNTGVLESAWTSIEAGGDVLPVYTWDGLGRLASIKDPVTNRAVYLAYAGSSTCTSASGFTAAPSGMICAIDYGDFSAGTTQVRYNSSGQLARFDDPGSAVTDYAYDSSGRISKIRDELASDAVAAGVRADNDTTRQVITYSGDKVSSVTLPEPLAGEARPAHTYTYVSDTTTDIAAAGLTSTSGRLRRVVFNSDGLPIQDIDQAGRTENIGYDSLGREFTRWDTSTGLKTTTVFDAKGRPTDTWGPAPTTWWPSTSAGGAPTSNAASTPHNVTNFDEGLVSLGATWWNNTTMTGEPAGSSLGVGDSSGRIVSNWSSGPAGQASGFSGAMMGWIDIPNTNTWTYKLDYAGTAQLLIGNQTVIDGSSGSSATGTYQGPAGPTRVLIRYINSSGSASLALSWKDTGGSYSYVPGSSLSPGLNLGTSSVNADGVTTVMNYSDTSSGLSPVDGVATSTTVDPSGLALSSSTKAEASGHRRPLSSQLPTGSPSEISTTYYADSATATIPCTGGATGVPQGGTAQFQTSADPDGSGSQTAIKKEIVVDRAGRLAASRVYSDGSNWTCVSYDSRGRVTKVEVPSLSARAGQVVETDYAVSGNPLVQSVKVTPSGGTARTVYTTTDLLGLERVHTDAWGNQTTTVYDQVGRPTSSTSAIGVYTVAPYDSDGNAGPTKLDGTTMATPHYDGAGRLTGVDYSNGTKSETITYDDLGRQSSLGWKTNGGSLITNDVESFSPGGRVIDQSVDGYDARTGNVNFTYDGAGRLLDAWTTAINGSGTASTLHTAYGYGDVGSACGSGTRSTAGKNTNRTSQVVGDAPTAVTTTYCYDDADRLVSTSASGVGSPVYDNHGNTTSIWGETRGYDAADHHVSTQKGSSTTTYERDATGRIIGRKVVVSGATTENFRMGYTSATDSPSFVQDSSGTLVEKTVPLPGGVIVTVRSSGQVWSYPNLRGDITATANGSGVKQGTTLTADVYGNATTSIPDNSAGLMDYGAWGADQRLTEHGSGYAVTLEMGARQFDPVLGRFLSVDPVQGGSANAYAYVKGDPLSAKDLDGRVLRYIGRAWLAAYPNAWPGGWARAYADGCGSHSYNKWICSWIKVNFDKSISGWMAWCTYTLQSLCGRFLALLANIAIAAATAPASDGLSVLIAAVLYVISPDLMVYGFDKAARRVLDWSGSGWPKIVACMQMKVGRGGSHPVTWNTFRC